MESWMLRSCAFISHLIKGANVCMKENLPYRADGPLIMVIGDRDEPLMMALLELEASRPGMLDNLIEVLPSDGIVSTITEIWRLSSPYQKALDETVDDDQAKSVPGVELDRLHPWRGRTGLPSSGLSGRGPPDGNHPSFRPHRVRSFSSLSGLLFILCVWGHFHMNLYSLRTGDMAIPLSATS